VFMEIMRGFSLKLILWTGFAGLLAAACRDGVPIPPLEPEYPYPEVSVALGGQKILARSANGTPVIHGGYGASMTAVKGEEGAFFLLTDRGPVADGAQPSEKVFIAKRFSPHIAKFKLAGDSMLLSNRITLNLPNGEATGIPPPPVNGIPGLGTSGETALDSIGRIIEPDVKGIDPQGLAVAPDGTFWVSENYGPSLLHFSTGGQLIERITPFAPDSAALRLPLVLARRQVGRGITGIAFTPDGSRLAAILQSPLANPDVPTGKSSNYTRLLIIDLQSGESTQYLYPLLETDTRVGELRAVSNTSFLVLEHDGKMPGAATDPARQKHIYRIDISGASDVSDPDNGENGKLVNGKTLEALSEAELGSAGIKTVSKELLVDLLEVFPDYPHDKPEGMTLVGNRKLAVINQDDYGIRSFSPPNGKYQSKILPRTDTIDRTFIYFIELPSPVLP